MKDRYDVFLELLPKNDFNVYKTAVEAGFAESTAEKQGKRIYQTALKKQAERLQQRKMELATNPDLNSKQITEGLKQITIAEKVGLSREEVMERIRFMATQERDLGVALKVIKALAKEYQVDLGEEESQKTIVPVLNVTVKEKNTAQQSHIIDVPTIEEDES